MARSKTHPLKAWRLTQRRIDHASKRPRPLEIAEAAAGVGVPYQTWYGWERWPEDGGRIPDRENMRKLHAFTNGQVRPDHFFDLASRADLAGDDAPAAAGAVA